MIPSKKSFQLVKCTRMENNFPSDFFQSTFLFFHDASKGETINSNSRNPINMDNICDVTMFYLQTRDGVRAEIEHYNCILRAEAVFAGIHTAQKTVEEMMEGKMGKHIRPNTATFNAMLEVKSFH